MQFTPQQAELLPAWCIVCGQPLSICGAHKHRQQKICPIPLYNLFENKYLSMSKACEGSGVFAEAVLESEY